MICTHKTLQGGCNCCDCPSYHNRCGWPTEDCPYYEPYDPKHPPCIDKQRNLCTDRVAGCHIRCDRYREFAVYHHELREKIRQLKEEERAILVQRRRHSKH